jgi:hypothetical protein
MKTLLRIAYFAVLYGLLAISSRAEEQAPADLTSPIAETTSVPEPGSIGLISVLVVLLALQRQR